MSTAPSSFQTERQPEYHGAPDDPRYPSPREWRWFLASVIDGALMFLGMAGVLLPPALLRQDWLMQRGSTTLFVSVVYLPLFLAMAGGFLAAFSNKIWLPSRTGSTLGQRATDLMWIRGSDASHPSIRELLFKTRGAFQTVGTRRYAPKLVVVRRSDLLPHNTAAGTDLSTGFIEY